MANRTTNIIAGILLLTMFLLAVFSIKGDSLTMDERAHLPAGYSYLTQKDMRLNPEHPPLLKDLAAIPFLFIDNINFPSEISAWKNEVNSQWDFGTAFLYNSGNPAEKMIFWGRVPMILILILLGLYIFKWTRKLIGNKGALLALFLFTFSPTFLAHGRLITTDVGAAAGVFIATYYFIESLQSPKKKNIIIAGIVFGIAQLLKFSVILLVPFFGLVALIWWLIKSGTLIQTIKILVLVFVIGFALIWPVYQFHVWNYPPEKQVADTQIYLRDTIEFLKKPILWAADKPFLRAYAYYSTGLSMVFHRVTGGNTTYFLGEVSNVGWRSYFPVVYLIKIPLAFHVLILFALIFIICLFRRFCGIKEKKKTADVWIKEHFPEITMLIFILIYWVVSITGNLNIGVRHLLPVFPFTICLVSIVLVYILQSPYLKLKYAVLAVLLLWQAGSVLAVYPHFLTYFNELAGGPANGYKYVVDSNLDWGQDLKRLGIWLKENNIDKIYIDYFGGSSPEYILKEKYAPWWGERSPEELPKGSYLAVSATLLQGGRGEVIPTLPQASGYYRWLNKYTPVTIIGHSIFIYKIE
ncbi:MAG TPA: glycosyltransferase family 39 protein [Candidatus Humimicrobiaceae bacterium]|nr:glycosyltransferase family 39 protein [Candidatus Humimicrobiaceae bacterium]